MDITKGDGNNTYIRTDGIHNQPFYGYRPQCILVFDSLNISPPVGFKTQELIYMLRFWLAHDKEINPSSIEFGNIHVDIL